MKNKKPLLRKLPETTKFATYDSDNEDIIEGEYIIATLIYNGTTFNQLLQATDEIEDDRERKDVKTEIIKIVLDFINLNPEYAMILEKNNKAHSF